MSIAIVIYDQASGHEGIHAIAQLFEDGWEEIEPLKFCPCCKLYYKTFRK